MKQGHVWRVWGVPTALAVLIVLGLLSALLGEHVIWKAIGWVALGVPVIIAVRYAWWRQRS